MKTITRFCAHHAHFFFEWEMFQIKVVEKIKIFQIKFVDKIKTYILCSIGLFFEIVSNGR